MILHSLQDLVVLLSHSITLPFSLFTSDSIFYVHFWTRMPDSTTDRYTLQKALHHQQITMLTGYSLHFLPSRLSFPFSDPVFSSRKTPSMQMLDNHGKIPHSIFTSTLKRITHSRYNLLSLLPEYPHNIFLVLLSEAYYLLSLVPFLVSSSLPSRTTSCSSVTSHNYFSSSLST